MPRHLSVLLLSFFVFTFTACNNASDNKENKTTDAKRIDGHPDWIMQGNIYEVNVRQYTPEGTFAAFGKHLDRLKEMGVQTLWFMPINPIGVVDRKGALGSYYAVSSYTAINPEYGTLDDFNTLVKQAHEKGMKVVIDWVPNHTSADHPWLTSHPDFFVKDSATGKAAVPFGWSDTRQLDYKNPAMRDSMMASMKYWINTSDIDGFRCDVAWNVPDDFWKSCIPELQKLKPDLFMLAEADGGKYHVDGFDASYPWTMFHMMNLVAAGKRDANALDSVLRDWDTTYPSNAIRLFFTSNHDENSWNKADYATMPGAIHAPFAVFTQTMGRSVPLIYSGQEEPVLDSLSFFYKDTIHFGQFKRAAFYTTLLKLRKDNPALSANASFRKIKTDSDNALYVYVREAAGKKVLVVLNLSAKEQSVKLTDASLYGEPLNLFMGSKEPVSDKPWNIEPWGYAVYVY